MKPIYVEHDLACSAYLKAKGHEFLKLIPLNHGRLAFEFSEDDSGTCAADALRYWQDGVVPAERFAHELRQMKSTLRNFKTESHKDEKDNARRQVLRRSNRS